MGKLPSLRKNSLLETIISRGDSIGGDVAQGTKELKFLANLYLSSKIDQMIMAAQAVNSRHLSAEMSALINKSGRLGLDAKALKELEHSFYEVVNSDSSPNSLRNFDHKINNVEAFANSSLIGVGLRTTALMIASFDLMNILSNHEEMDGEQALAIGISSPMQLAEKILIFYTVLSQRRKIMKQSLNQLRAKIAQHKYG